MDNILINENKNCERTYNGETYARYALKTPLITNQDNIVDIAQMYAAEHLQKGDILFFSEKAVACTQNRAIPLDDIHPSFLAKLLSRFVYKSPYGIGLAIPETMEMALRECGKMRILWAACCSAVGKVFGKRGVFYKIAGEKARAIDGPTSGTIPPLDRCVVLGPENPIETAQKIADALECEVLIIDANDLGINILGWSKNISDVEKYKELLRDNPLGQKSQSTPMGILRLVNQQTC